MSEKSSDSFPQEIIPDVISYLKRLQRKGIKSIYLDPAVAESSAGVASTAEPPPQQEIIPDAEPEESVTVTPPQNSLAGLEATVAACKECPLHEGRTRTVFGAGNPKTNLLFIGEAPGRDEDRVGVPFVGRAGQLLTKIIEAIDLQREDVYITNILKCRPPENRDPQETEVRCCEKYLIAQIELIKPKVICALGRIAAQWLLQTKSSLGALRTGEHTYQGIPVLVTYHPAALLRNPHWKRPTWEDFKKLKKML